MSECVVCECMRVPISSSPWWSVFLHLVLISVNYSWYFWKRLPINLILFVCPPLVPTVMMRGWVMHQFKKKTHTHKQPLLVPRCPERDTFRGTIASLITLSFPSLSQPPHRKPAYFPSWWMVWILPPPPHLYFFFILSGKSQFSSFIFSTSHPSLLCNCVCFLTSALQAAITRWIKS